MTIVTFPSNDGGSKRKQLDPGCSCSSTSTKTGVSPSQGFGVFSDGSRILATSFPGLFPRSGWHFRRNHTCKFCQIMLMLGIYSGTFHFSPWTSKVARFAALCIVTKIENCLKPYTFVISWEQGWIKNFLIGSSERQNSFASRGEDIIRGYLQEMPCLICRVLDERQNAMSVFFF